MALSKNISQQQAALRQLPDELLERGIAQSPNEAPFPQFLAAIEMTERARARKSAGTAIAASQMQDGTVVGRMMAQKNAIGPPKQAPVRPQPQQLAGGGVVRPSYGEGTTGDGARRLTREEILAIIAQREGATQALGLAAPKVEQRQADILGPVLGPAQPQVGYDARQGRAQLDALLGAQRQSTIDSVPLNAEAPRAAAPSATTHGLPTMEQRQQVVGDINSQAQFEMGIPETDAMRQPPARSLGQVLGPRHTEQDPRPTELVKGPPDEVEDPDVNDMVNKINSMTGTEDEGESELARSRRLTRAESLAKMAHAFTSNKGDWVEGFGAAADAGASTMSSGNSEDRVLAMKEQTRQNKYETDTARVDAMMYKASNDLRMGAANAATRRHEAVSENMARLVENGLVDFEEVKRRADGDQNEALAMLWKISEMDLMKRMDQSPEKEAPTATNGGIKMTTGR